MRMLAPLNVGSVADRVVACTMSLRGCIDWRSLSYRAPAVLRCLGQLAGRTGPGLAEAAEWLRQTIAEHPVLSEPRAAGVKHELRTLAERLGR